MAVEEGESDLKTKEVEGVQSPNELREGDDVEASQYEQSSGSLELDGPEQHKDAASVVNDESMEQDKTSVDIDEVKESNSEQECEIQKEEKIEKGVEADPELELESPPDHEPELEQEHEVHQYQKPPLEGELEVEQNLDGQLSKETENILEGDAVPSVLSDHGDLEGENRTENDQDDDEFGEFDDFDDFEEFESSQPSGQNDVDEENHITEAAPSASVSASDSHIPCLSESDFSNSAQLQASVRSTLKDMWSATTSADEETQQPNAVMSEQHITVERTPTPSPDRSPQYHITEPGSYFSERSASLWQQLVVDAPHVNPTDWKRSSIRRLLLVSLGIPLDLDEILPNKNTKRLVLPMSSTRRVSGGEQGADSRDDKSIAGNKTTGGSPGSKRSEHEKEILRNDTETKLATWHQLSIVSSEALEGMNEAELETHVDTLKKALIDAQGISTQWQELLQVALQDKETFEGVIESLLEYAQRLRTRSK